MMNHPHSDMDGGRGAGPTPDGTHLPDRSPRADVRQGQEAARTAASERKVEIRIVHERPADAHPQVAAGDRHAGARWLWRILALVGLAVVGVLGLELLAGVHQMVAGQAAQTAAINRQTGVLQGIGQQLAGIRTAIDSLVAAVNRAVGALVHLGAGG